MTASPVSVLPQPVSPDEADDLAGADREARRRRGPVDVAVGRDERDAAGPATSSSGPLIAHDLPRVEQVDAAGRRRG